MKEIINELNEIMGADLKESDIFCKVIDVFKWDSYNIMNLMVAVQDKYNITLDISQISEIETVCDIVLLIKGRD